MLLSDILASLSSLLAGIAVATPAPSSNGANVPSTIGVTPTSSSTPSVSVYVSGGRTYTVPISTTTPPSPVITTGPPVIYNGPGITGTAQLPASLSTVVFPTNTVVFPFPQLGSRKLGQNALQQAITNGLSKLGTLNAGKLASFLGSSIWGSSTSGAPWGGRTASNTNPYKNPPNSGVTRSYTFNVARATMAPDGVQRQMLVVNNQFPGPLIEANWGDTISVTIQNNIVGPTEGTAFHWHGFLQKTTEYEDGVPGITQCPIAPGESFTYNFKADTYGTSWWHSHYSAQYSGGVMGPIIIHGPESAKYDADLGPVILSDYYHDDYNTVLSRVMGIDLSVAVPFSQNNLINGKNNYNCSLITDGTPCTPNAGLSKFQFTSGKTYRLRLINAGTEGIQRFSLDGHSMQVMAYDFVPIVPYTTNVVTLGIGQRADVLIKANGSASSSYWMRSSISTTCSLTFQPDALAIVSYQNADTNAEPTTKSWPIDDTYCGNDPLPSTVPYMPIAPPQADTRVDVAVSFAINSSGNFIWTVDGSSFRTDYNNPILPLLQANNATDNIANFPDEWNIYNFGTNKSFVIVVNNQNPIAHPMHIHGHNMYVLSQGVGVWDGLTQGDSSNPARRDVQILPPSGYIAIQVEADNPGVWPFHCHIGWHVSGGLYMNILERPADIPKTVKTPKAVNDLCKSWNAYTSSQVVGQIDSGVKLRRGETEEHVLAQIQARRHAKRHAIGGVRHDFS